MEGYLKREETTILKDVAAGDLKVAEELFSKLAGSKDDGKITEDEFVKIGKRLHLGFLGEDVARDAFKEIDASGDGALTVQDVMAAFTKLKGLAEDAKKTEAEDAKNAENK